MKHLDFNSVYLPNFQVVEQRKGNVSLFPHTDQLPKLLRALNFDFCAGLPDKIARVDHRAKDYLKIQRFTAVLMFCNHVNRARQDKLRLHVLTDRNLVARVSIVQQIITHEDDGSIHRFKFYAGDDFFTDIYLNGKQIAFASHALDRFSQRVPNSIGTDLTNLLSAFFGSSTVVMKCNNNPAFVYNYGESVIAFPVRQSDTEYFFPTCLSVSEIHKLEPIIPPPAYTLHYDPLYKEPKVRNWDTIQFALALHDIWKCKAPLRPHEVTKVDKMSWPEIAHKVNDVLKTQGLGEGSRLLFLDNIPGSCTIRLRPKQQEERHVELEDLKRLFPNDDWERIVTEQKAANPAWY